MLRWIWRAAPTPSRIVTEDEFISEVLQMAEHFFVGTPAGPITIEALEGDPPSVQWRAYYRHPGELLALARQLCDERALRARGSGAPHGRRGRGGR